MLTSLLVNLLVILIVVAILWLILYLFQKYITPIDNRIVGAIIFIIAAILIIYALTGHRLLG